MANLESRFLDVLELMWRERMQARAELRDRLPSGASVGDLYVLDAILRQDHITMSDLARILGITPATATTAVNRLVRHGWAIRVSDDHDRRVIRLRATAHGRRIHESRDAFRRELAARMLARLPEPEAEMLIALLERVYSGVPTPIGIPRDERE